MILKVNVERMVKKKKNQLINVKLYLKKIKIQKKILLMNYLLNVMIGNFPAK